MKYLSIALQRNKQINGLYIGEVVNNTDSKNRNRIQVKINGITDEVDNDANYLWAEQGGPIAKGSKTVTGISTSPSVGELVYIMFLNGSPSHPIYFAMVRGGGDASSDYDDNYVIHTPDGQKIIIGKSTLKLVNGDSVVEMSDTIVNITCINFNVDSYAFTHTGTDVVDTHTHNEPNGIVWSSSGQIVTDVPN